MIGHLLSSGLLTALMSAVGIRTAEKLEKQVAGGKALSVRGLIARRSVMAAVMQQMKQHRSKNT